VTDPVPDKLPAFNQIAPPEPAPAPQFESDASAEIVPSITISFVTFPNITPPPADPGCELLPPPPDPG